MGVDPGTDGLTLAELAARQDQMATVVAALAQTVERLSARASAGATSAPSRACDVDGAELVESVSWLAEHYELAAALPACWPRHGAIVEELAALHGAWQTVGNQGGPALAQWHYHLDRTLARIEGRWRTCIDGTHHPATPADWLEAGPDGADGIDLIRDRCAPPESEEPAFPAHGGQAVRHPGSAHR